VGLRLLCVCAHPDDECFAFGGALALAADRGVEVSLLCFTEGTAGSYRGTAKTDAELGQLRRAELADSCAILGIQHYEVLSYQDGQMEHADFSRLAGELVGRIRALRPDVVLTFGMDGAPNTHPDHTVVSGATTAAVHWAASPKRYPELGPVYVTPRLYHQTQSFFLEGRPQPLPAPDAHAGHSPGLPPQDRGLPRPHHAEPAAGTSAACVRAARPAGVLHPDGHARARPRNAVHRYVRRCRRIGRSS
jgi:LmbE family N-acetylglucosaminyl deacetylase